MVNDMVKDGKRDGGHKAPSTLPSISEEGTVINNPTSSTSAKAIVVSEEHANKEHSVEFKRMDSWDLLAQDLHTEHHHQLDAFKLKISVLTEKNDLLREEIERLKASTGGPIIHNNTYMRLVYNTRI